MPIDYSKYPPNWLTEIRPRILLRANHCCEVCGVPNYTPIGGTFQKPKKVILTIAHLDHDPENWDVQDERLQAMCQKCHLQYDRLNNAYKRKYGKNASQNQIKLELP
ncbi:MAG: hypothetical protein EBR82_17510 [Caulobacteraceae bacterium]|nr:hypothetical protein [Caulobacteraceae bacterium]